MKKLMMKFSDERNRRFSIKTTIALDDESGEKFVLKEAAFPEGQGHLNSILYYRDLLTEYYPSVTVCPVEKRQDTLWFAFISGESLEEMYRRSAKEKDREKFLALARIHRELIEGREENRCEFHSFGDFERIFGDGEPFEGSAGLRVSNFDATAGNIIYRGAEPVFIDYEWVFDKPLPRDLVVYHCIRDVYFHISKLEEFVSLQEVMDTLGIQTEIEVMEKAYRHFHSYVVKEADGKSFGAMKAGALKGTRDAQELQKEIDSLKAQLRECEKNWQECAENWKASVKANDEISAYWKESSRANFQLGQQINKLQEQLAAQDCHHQEHVRQLEAAVQEQARQSEVWRVAYETVINSKTWRAANKVKRALGKK